jgi:hypothetical protein
LNLHSAGGFVGPKPEQQGSTAAAVAQKKPIKMTAIGQAAPIVILFLFVVVVVFG